MFGIILERFIDLLGGTLYPKDVKAIVPAPVLLLGGDESDIWKKSVDNSKKLVTLTEIKYMKDLLLHYFSRVSEHSMEEPRKTLTLNEDTKVMLPAIKVSKPIY